MYDREPQNPKSVAITECIELFANNWPRFENPNWQQQMSKLLKASFRDTHHQTLLKAGWSAIAKIDGDYPPSMGKIIKEMESYIGSGAARTPKAEQCDKCNCGFILVSFWMILDDTSYKQDVQCACDCDYGKKRQSSLNAVPFRDFIALNTEHPKRYISNRYPTWQKEHDMWVQGKTYIIDEIPTDDEMNVRYKSKDLPPVEYYERGFDDEKKQRRAHLRQSLAETFEQKNERLQNIGLHMQQAIKELAENMSIPVPKDYDQLPPDPTDEEASSESTEEMVKNRHQYQNDHDTSYLDKKPFEDDGSFDWY
jgi:hypothetical protein